MYRDIVKNLISPVFVDVGANVGHHSLFMSQYCSEVHAFEPNPLVRTKLEEKIEINMLNNIYVHSVGLSDRAEELPFYSPKGCNQGTGSFVSEHSNNNEEHGMLKVVSADDYISNLNLEKIDLIKIDVEGFEKNVLLGMKKTISKYRPAIIVEYSTTTRNSFSDLNELISLFPVDYKIKKIVSDEPYLMFFNLTKCRYIDFDFNTSGGDILCCPENDL